MRDLPPFSTVPRSILYRNTSIALGSLLVLATSLWWVSRTEWFALYCSISNDWLQVEQIETYRKGGSHGTVANAVNCLRQIVEFKLPDGYRPPKHPIRTFPPTIVIPTTDIKQDAFAKLHRMVDIARAAAVGDIIAYLRSKTGDDLGGDPQRWIAAYATTK